MSFNILKGFAYLSGLMRSVREHYLSGLYGYVPGFGRPGQGFRVLKAPVVAPVAAKRIVSPEESGTSACVSSYRPIFL